MYYYAIPAGISSSLPSDIFRVNGSQHNSPRSHASPAPPPPETAMFPDKPSSQMIVVQKSPRLEVKRLRCDEPGCTYRNTFRRRYELERHRKTRHRRRPGVGNAKFYRCLQKECANKQSMPRLDHFRKHVARSHPQLIINDEIRSCAISEPDAFPVAQHHAATSDSHLAGAPSPHMQRSGSLVASHSTSLQAGEGCDSTDVAVLDSLGTPPGRAQTPLYKNTNEPELILQSARHLDNRLNVLLRQTKRVLLRQGGNDRTSSPPKTARPGVLSIKQPSTIQPTNNDVDSLAVSLADSLEKASIPQNRVHPRRKLGNQVSRAVELLDDTVPGEPISAPPILCPASAASSGVVGVRSLTKVPSGQFCGRGSSNASHWPSSSVGASSSGSNIPRSVPSSQRRVRGGGTPSISSYRSLRSVSTNEDPPGRFPCFYYDWVLGHGPTKACSKFHQHVSQIEPHTHRQEHLFFYCALCVTRFRELEEWRQHRENRGNACQPRCVTEWCVNFYRPGSACVHGINEQEYIYRALYRLARGLHIRAPVPGIAEPPGPTATTGPHEETNTDHAASHQSSIAGHVNIPETFTTAQEQPLQAPAGAGHYSELRGIEPIDPTRTPLGPHDGEGSPSVEITRRVGRYLFLARLMWNDIDQPNAGWSPPTGIAFNGYHRDMQSSGVDLSTVNEHIRWQYDSLCGLISAFATYLNNNGAVDNHRLRQMLILMEPFQAQILQPTVIGGHAQSSLTDPPTDAPTWHDRNSGLGTMQPSYPSYQETLPDMNMDIITSMSQTTMATSNEGGFVSTLNDDIASSLHPHSADSEPWTSINVPSTSAPHSG